MTKKYRFLLKSVFFLVLSYFIFRCVVSYQFKNIKNTSPAYFVSANTILNDFKNNEQEANKKYTNKIIQVYGVVKEISHLNNRKTIILSSNSSSSIICDLDDAEKIQIQNFKKNQQLYIKGICKGYLEDVILLNCFIVTQNNHE